MKPWFLVILLLMFLVAACGRSGQGGDLPYPPGQQPGPTETQPYPPPQATSPTRGYPAPQQTPARVSWDKAKVMILDGKVSEVIELQSRTVYLVLADGTQWMTEEPEIGDAQTAIDECGAPCENIQIITE